MKRITLILGICILWIANVAAQETVYGTVVDGKNDPVPGARVEIVDRSEYVVTDIDGDFRFDLPVKATKIRVTYPGYKPIIRDIKPGMIVKLGSGWAANPRGFRGMYQFEIGFGFGGNVNVQAGNNFFNNIHPGVMAGGSWTLGYQFNKNLFVGIGYGVDYYSLKMDTSGEYESGSTESYGANMKFYADARWDFGLAEKTAPYVGLKLGYQYVSDMEEYDDWWIAENYIYNNGGYSSIDLYGEKASGVLIEPYVGMHTRIKNKFGFNIGLSYNMMLPKKLYAEYEFSQWQNDLYESKRIDLGRSVGGAVKLHFGFDF